MVLICICLMASDAEHLFIRVFRNHYKGHMDRNQGGAGKQRREMGLAGVGGVVGKKHKQL